MRFQYCFIYARHIARIFSSAMRCGEDNAAKAKQVTDAVKVALIKKADSRLEVSGRQNDADCVAALCERSRPSSHNLDFLLLRANEVKKMIRDDPRYAKFSSSERKCEKEFKEYLKDKMAAAKSDFRELLKETKTITYKSKKQIEESEQHLLDIQKVLEKDKRYLVLSCIPDERRKLLMAYVEDLDRRGPPPPPTASEPTRRSNK